MVGGGGWGASSYPSPYKHRFSHINYKLGKFPLFKGALSSSFNEYLLAGHGRASVSVSLGLVVSNDYFSKHYFKFDFKSECLGNKFLSLVPRKRLS